MHTRMSLISHLAVLGLVVIDLVVGSPVVGHLAGRWAAIGFEFAILVGYVLLILQWLPWRRPDGG